MRSEEAVKIVLAAAQESNDGHKTLPCAKAFEISRQHGIALNRIGKICDQEGVKLTACRLGCF